ncbi:MFS general substrate transporter [Thozetella sp. PMI_491]|nr:MFS general substrate transporter [Thozetella sp. PMI_491]
MANKAVQDEPLSLADKEVKDASSVEISSPEDEYENHRRAILSHFNAEDDKMIMRKVGLPSNVLNELHMTADDYNWLQTLYFLVMVLFEVPSNLVLKKVTPRKWQTRIFFTWGIVVVCHAAVSNKQGVYAVRFLLGALEAGFFPGLMTQMCSWYRIIGSLLVYGISYMDGVGNLSTRRWVYLLEGIITTLFAFVIYFYLPDYPKSTRSAKWLTPEEQEYLEVRLSENAPRSDESSFKLSEIVDSLKDPRIIFFTACQFFLNVAGYGFSWQLPTIVMSLGFATLPKNQLLLIPPAVATVIGQITVAWLLRRAYVVRPVLNLVICIGMLVFYNVLCFPVSAGATYTTAMAQIGATVAPNVFPSAYAYNGYKISFYICTACVAAAFLTTLIAWYLARNLEYDVWQVRRKRI